MSRFARTLGLGLLLYPVGFATHEVMHLVIYSVQGVPAILIVTHWELGTLGLSIFGVHAAPVNGSAVTFPMLVLNNGLGPTLAAALLLVLVLSTDRRSRVAGTALLANVLVLLFFATLELAYPLIEHYGRVEADVLLLPELNYGGVLVILVLTSLGSTWRPGARRRRRADDPTQERRPDPAPRGERLTAP